MNSPLGLLPGSPGVFFRHIYFNSGSPGQREQDLTFNEDLEGAKQAPRGPRRRVLFSQFFYLFGTSLMPDRSFQGMELLSAVDLERILQVTDALQLHRDWVVVPIDAVVEGHEIQQPDGKIIIHAARRDSFEVWLKGLRTRLQELHLGAVPRPTQNDPKESLTGPHEFRAQGTRTYLGALGILR